LARVAVVTMKSALRGRVRREITFLLGCGYEVMVIGRESDEDFSQGLIHPRLSSFLIAPQSIYVKARHLASRRNAGSISRRPTDGNSPSVQGDASAEPVDSSHRLEAAKTRRTTIVPAHEEVRENSAFYRVIIRSVRRFMRLMWRILRKARRGVRRTVRRTIQHAVRALLLPWHRISLYMDFWSKSKQAAMKWNPDLIHSCDLEGLVGGSRAATRLRVPHVHDCHELFLERTLFSNLEKKILGQFERQYIRRASAITVVSQSIGLEIERRYEVQSIVLRNCADVPAHIQPRDIRLMAGLASETSVVLYQGGFAAGRGLEDLIRTVPRFPAGVALVLLGYGPLRLTLQNLARSESLTDRVRFVDAVPPDDLLDVTASATLGILPYQPVSLNNRLALPNKIFEYLSVGVPVVAADLPELRRIVSNGCGRIYDPFNSSGLSSAVKDLLQDDNLELAREAALTYGRENTWSVEQQILMATYARVLGKGDRSLEQ
jgi:glycosyltransferase involved in cell wall biosynthesis